MGRNFYTPDGIHLNLDALGRALDERNAFAAQFYADDDDSLQRALDRADVGDAIYIGPGEYVEPIVVARAQSALTIIGTGNRGAVAVAPDDTNATALTIEADDVTVINVGCDGAGTGAGLLNRGRRTRVIGSKIEGGTVGLKLTLGTDAQITAGTHGKGDDLWFTDCEVAYNTKGVELVATDYGALTQVRFRGCTFHDNTAADFEESHGAGGAVGVHFRDLDIGGCAFLRMEAGTQPTKYLSLNDDNGNTGVVHDNTFATALDGGKNLVSTGLIWVANKHTGGISGAQPS